MLKQTIEAIKNYFFKPTTKVYYFPYTNEIVLITLYPKYEVLESSSQGKSIITRKPYRPSMVDFYEKFKQQNLVVELGDL